MTRNIRKTGGARKESIQRFMKALEGEAHMLLDHIAGNAKPAGDFTVRKFLVPAHDENLAASGWKLLHGLVEAP